MGKPLLTRFPLIIGKNILATSTARVLLNQSTQQVIDGNAEFDIEGLTVEAIANKTPFEVSGIVSGMIFAAGTAWGYRKLKFRERFAVMNSVQRMLRAKLGSLINSQETVVRVWETINQNPDNITDEAAGMLIELANQREQVQTMEAILLIGETTNDTKKKVVLTDILPENVIYDLREIAGLDVDEFVQQVADIVRSNEYFEIPENEKALRNLLFVQDDLLGYRKVLSEQIEAIEKLEQFGEAGIVEQAQLPRSDFDEPTDEGRYLSGQKRSAERKLAELRDINEEFESIVDEFFREQNIDPETGKIISKNKAVGKFVSKWGGRFLFFDNLLWVGTTVIDISLNPFLPEEEQGFFADRIGYSLIDEYAITPLIDWIFGTPDITQFAVQEIIDATQDSETLTGVVYGVLLFFYNEFNFELSFDIDATATGEFIADSLFTDYDPTIVLVGAYLFIVGWVVLSELIVPSLRSLVP